MLGLSSSALPPSSRTPSSPPAGLWCEGISFLHYDTRYGRVVAVFRGEDAECQEIVFDRASLQERMLNLRAQGMNAETTLAVLNSWPETVDRRGAGLAAEG